MATFDKSIVIAAPLNKVFDYVSQPEHFPIFLPITDLTFITNMHRGVGTRLRYSLNLGGKRILTECNLTKLEADKGVNFHTTRGVACDWEFTVNKVEAGTQLHWKSQHEMPAGILDKLLGTGARMARGMEAAIDEGLQKIKEILESR